MEIMVGWNARETAERIVTRSKRNGKKKKESPASVWIKVMSESIQSICLYVHRTPSAMNIILEIGRTRESAAETVYTIINNVVSSVRFDACVLNLHVHNMHVQLTTV